MRRIAAVLLMSLFAVPVFAADPLRLSVFVSDVQFSRSDIAGTDWNGGFGLGLEYRFNPGWSAELSVAREEHTQVIIPFDDVPGLPAPVIRTDVRSYPVDVTARRHFFATSRWQPFLGAGVRYVDGPTVLELEHDNRISAQVIGGVDFMATERFGLRFDAKRLLRGDSEIYDDTMKVSVGATWRF